MLLLAVGFYCCAERVNHVVVRADVEDVMCEGGRRNHFVARLVTPS